MLLVRVTSVPLTSASPSFAETVVLVAFKVPEALTLALTSAVTVLLVRVTSLPLTSALPVVAVTVVLVVVKVPDALTLALT
ncbi:hypothetical protein [Psittacicella melopsittaci]|uniref:hypothetical protein n=1 Tax=Psittacicella melopsittaci TaxID=2028576 RepID=UPI0011C403A5|nr:hypothetical protein [Psittacicella melopsittaci]